MAVNIRRREIVTTLAGAVAARPLAMHAQQPKVPTIGALVIGNIDPEQFRREFRQGLRDLGMSRGKTSRFEFRSAEGHLERLSELATKSVRLKVDIIVTWFTPTAVAAKQATHDIRSSWPRREIRLARASSLVFLGRAEMSPDRLR